MSRPRLAAAAAIESEPGIGIAGKVDLAREGMALAPFPGAMKVVKSFCENVKTDGIGIGIAPENGTETGIGTGAMGGDVTVPAVSPETATAIRGAGGHLPENANEHGKTQPSATHGEAAAGGEEAQEISPMSHRRHRLPGRVKVLLHLLLRGVTR